MIATQSESMNEMWNTNSALRFSSWLKLIPTVCKEGQRPESMKVKQSRREEGRDEKSFCFSQWLQLNLAREFTEPTCGMQAKSIKKASDYCSHPLNDIIPPVADRF